MQALESVRRFAALCVLTFGVIGTAVAQESPPETAAASQPTERKRLTWELVRDNRVSLTPRLASGMRWLDDGRHYVERRDGERVRVDAETGEATPEPEDDAFVAALRTIDGLDDDGVQRIARDADFIKDRSAATFAHDGARYHFDRVAGTVRRVFEPKGTRELSATARAGYFVFLRDHNLHSVRTRDGHESILTSDGSETLLNGVLDWVYQEEVYGRGNFRGYWVSDDERFVAYLQLDEANVPIHTIVHHVSRPQRIEQQRYPKAGEANPPVRVGVVPIEGGSTVWADLSRYEGSEPLVVRVCWAPDGGLLLQVQDREQRWLHVVEVDPTTGAARVLIEEHSPAWVNVLEQPNWLADGSFLWFSERDGWKHLYHYARDGRLIRRLTGGDWDVRGLEGVDEEEAWVYFTGTRDDYLSPQAFRVPLAGGAVQRLTAPGFSHRVSFDPKCRFFFDTFSNVSTPTSVALRRADGRLVRELSTGEAPALDEYLFSTPELVEFAARDGYRLRGMLIRPPDFDPQQRYPVWCPVYAGPQSATFSNTWASRGALTDQFLAQQGILVWYCDPRPATNNGVISAWSAYQRLGEQELADIEDGVRWLIDQGLADPERIGIGGGSYGGFMVCFAMTHSRLFSCGAAGYAVTDWRSYDTIYTERYMRTPQNNPEGYDRTSCVKAASELRGELLIYHGMIDDNVHVHNTIEFTDALQAAGKPFQMMLYALDRHGIGRGGSFERHQRMDFILSRLTGRGLEGEPARQRRGEGRRQRR